MILATLPPACQNEVRDANNQLLKTLEANKKKTGFTINEVGDVSNEELFSSIISKYRGKVILVDFWQPGAAPAAWPIKQVATEGRVERKGHRLPLHYRRNLPPENMGEHDSGYPRWSISV